MKSSWNWGVGAVCLAKVPGMGEPPLANIRWPCQGLRVYLIAHCQPPGHLGLLPCMIGFLSSFVPFGATRIFLLPRITWRLAVQCAAKVRGIGERVPKVGGIHEVGLRAA